MIVTRAPVRFSLGGGGTDLPSYAREHGGFVVSLAIDKYVRVAVTPRDDTRTVVRCGAGGEHDSPQTASRVDDVTHGIVRESLRACHVEGGLEIRSSSDVPAGSGLGSSGAFTVALLDALHTMRGRVLARAALARLACHVEMDRLAEPVGKQDPYIAAFGGLRAFHFHPDGRVTVERVPVTAPRLHDFTSRLVVLWSGVTRSASRVLAVQQENIAAPAGTNEALARMHRIKALGHETLRILRRGSLDAYGELLHEHWTAKRSVASTISDGALDEHYEAARRAGAIGGKLMGAGGGGFFMFQLRPSQRDAFVARMAARGLRELPFAVDPAGARSRLRPELDEAIDPLPRSA